MTSKGSKLVALALIAVVLAAGAGYWFLTPKMPNELVSTVQQTSLLTPSERTQISTTSATPTSSTTTWIIVGASQPASYYLSLLESNGTEPYVELAKELRKLPDLKNATAAAKITYLALNATNPEVKEAFELIIKGGTPDQGDFPYAVPKYNTELQILYWLACGSAFKRDDTLALAVAMVNGFWVTIGDDQVDRAVMNDTGQLLGFFRETAELQKQRGYFDLEEYPLEAKLSLSWTGGDPARGGRAWYQLLSGGATYERTLNTHHFLEYATRIVRLEDYRWNTVWISTLRQMQRTMTESGWIVSSVDKTVENIEEYFYFSGFRQHWIFTQPNDTIIAFNGERTIDHNMNNPNWVFDYYLRTGEGLGVCGDEASLIEALCKSWGVATIRLTRTYGTKGGNNHDHVVYYEPTNGTWKCYVRQLNIGRSGTWNVYLFQPPVILHDYFVCHRDSQQTWMKMYDVYYVVNNVPAEQTAASFLKGIPTTEFKQWLLYAKSATTATTATIQEGSWNTLADGSLDVLSENGTTMGDMGQPYIDIASIRYSCIDGSLYVRFDLNGRIPQSIKSGRVTAIWYQMLLDVDSDYNTGVIWDDHFTPDYMLELYVRFDGPSGSAKVSSFVLKYSGNGTDWTNWTEIESTTRTGSDATVEGGLGYNYLTIRCAYDDIGVSKGSQVTCLFRSGILYEDNVYNDPDPDTGPISIVLPE